MAHARRSDEVGPTRTTPVVGAWGLLIALGLTGCGQPAAEPVVSAPTRAGETLSAPRPASPSVHSSVSPRAQPAASASMPGEQARQAHLETEAAQWQQWYATARESPDVSVRLQALETWAQRPADQIDPVTYGLVDEDESVRQRAQTLYEQQLAREATGPEPTAVERAPESSSGP